MQLPSSSNVDQLHRRGRVALGEAAHDLALDDHRVDPDAAVVDRDDLDRLPLARAAVDLDDDHVRAEREGHVRRVVVRDALEPGLHPVGEVRVRGERDVLDRLRPLGRALHEEPSRLELDVVGRRLEQVGGDLLAPCRAACARSPSSPRPPPASSGSRTCRVRRACCRCRPPAPRCPRSGSRAPPRRSARTSSRAPAPAT